MKLGGLLFVFWAEIFDDGQGLEDSWGQVSLLCHQVKWDSNES